MRIFGHCFGSFNYCMFSKLSWQEKSNSCLDLSWWKGISFVISNKSACFCAKFFKQIINEWVHDAHWSFRNTCMLVDLSQNSENIYWECLFSCFSMLPHNWNNFLCFCCASFTGFSCHLIILIKINNFGGIINTIIS